MSNKRLEDIYIGILASIFSIPINDISSHCVSFEHKDIEAKSFFLLENGIDNTAFIWESREFDYFWNVILGFYTNRESVVKIPNILERFYYSFVYRLFFNLIKLVMPTELVIVRINAPFDEFHSLMVLSLEALANVYSSIICKLFIPSHSSFLSSYQLCLV